MASNKQLIIDCDPGNDDAMAILMALSHTDVDVKAITCVEGNATVMQTGRNALRTLQVANRLQVRFTEHIRISKKDASAYNSSENSEFASACHQ